jgi:hypothetical protein
MTNKAHACEIPKDTKTHTERHTYCFSITSMVARTLLNVRDMYIACLVFGVDV